MMTSLDSETIAWIEDILASHYDIGPLKRVRRLTGGFINTSYEVVAEPAAGLCEKYLLRCYRASQREEDIRFEHALLNALSERNFGLHPRPIATTAQTTYLRVNGPEMDIPQGMFLSLFNYIQGESRYRWDYPVCGEEDFRQAASVLARYHNTIHRWEGTRLCCHGPVIDAIPEMRNQWQQYVGQTGPGPFDTYLRNHADAMFRHLDWVRMVTRTNGYAEMPQLVVHGDYHPGNLKFHGSRVIGLLDFDWSRRDFRSFDVGLALTYFCTSWEPRDDGRFLPDRMAQFLRAYQQKAAGMAGLGPLNALELAHLPAMIVLGNLFILNWILDTRFIEGLSDEKHLRYLQHNTNAAKSLDVQWQELERVPALGIAAD